MPLKPIDYNRKIGSFLPDARPANVRIGYRRFPTAHRFEMVIRDVQAATHVAFTHQMDGQYEAGSYLPPSGTALPSSDTGLENPSRVSDRAD
jgi:hypothetical protein